MISKKLESKRFVLSFRCAPLADPLWWNDIEFDDVSCVRQSSILALSHIRNEVHGWTGLQLVIFALNFIIAWNKGD